jgi:hypothetical protein
MRYLLARAKPTTRPTRKASGHEVSRSCSVAKLMVSSDVDAPGRTTRVGALAWPVGVRRLPAMWRCLGSRRALSLGLGLGLRPRRSRLARLPVLTERCRLFPTEFALGRHIRFPRMAGMAQRFEVRRVMPERAERAEPVQVVHVGGARSTPMTPRMVGQEGGAALAPAPVIAAPGGVGPALTPTARACVSVAAPAGRQVRATGNRARAKRGHGQRERITTNATTIMASAAKSTNMAAVSLTQQDRRRVYSRRLGNETRRCTARRRGGDIAGFERTKTRRVSGNVSGQIR